MAVPAQTPHQDEHHDRPVTLSSRGRELLARRLARRASDTVAPLSADQRRLWFLAQFDPDDTAYNMFVTDRLRGPLDATALSRALDTVTARHEPLRTRFVADDDRPTQRIAPPTTVPIEHVDLMSLPEKAREAEAIRVVTERVGTPFDLAAGAPLRATLIGLAPHEHVLCLVLHHIVSDGWSLNILRRELATCYSAHSRAVEPDLPPLPGTYRDQVALRDRPDEETVAEHLAYWRERLADVPALEPPADRPRPALRTSDGAVVTMSVPAVVTARIDHLARSRRCTPFMVLLAAYQVLLYRHTGQTDFAVGSPAAGRHSVDAEGLVGLFVRTLALRADISGDPPFTEVMRRVRSTLLGALGHDEVPFERLLTELRVPRDTARTPLFQTMFLLRDADAAPDARPVFDGLEVSPFRPDRQDAMVDLSVEVRRDGATFSMFFTYATALFDEDTVTRIAERFVTLLTSVTADPETPVSRAAIAPAAELRAITAEASATATDRPRTSTVRLFAEQAARTPSATAVVDDETTLTYARLDVAVRSLAARLNDAGVVRGAPVAVRVERSVDMVVALLGVLASGGAYVPLDPAYPNSRTEFVLADSGARIMVTDPSGPPSPPGVTPVYARRRGGRAPEPVTWPEPDDAAYTIYTSGSTGRPKGVTVDHGALTNFLLGMSALLDSEPGHTWLATTSIAFDISALEMYLPLVTGGRVVVARGADPTPLAEHPVTHVQATPAGWRMLLAAGFDAPSVVGLTGGETLPIPLAVELRGGLRRLINMYGPTETTIWSTAWEVPPGPSSVRIGSPIANTSVYVCDDHLNAAPIDVPGELLIGGHGVARGYRNRPGETARRFVPDPFGPPGARLYRTGDRARRRADGTVEFLGRMDRQIKLRGHRIEPGEVEARLLDLPGVEQAVVLARDDTLVAYVVGEAADDVDDVRTHCARFLPDSMVPNVVVPLDRLPSTPNGKLDRAALPPPDTRGTGGSDGNRPVPDDRLAREIAAIWSELLDVRDIGADDDLFALGGHSLTVVAIAARVRERLDVDLPLPVFFDAPTVVGVAAAVREHLDEKGRPE